MAATELAIPQGWDEITPQWITAALAPHFPGAEVGDLRVVLRDDGTNRRARLALDYVAGSGPATVFGKAVDPEHADLVALTSGLYHEPRLFSSGVTLPLDHPAVYAAIIDEDRRDFLMIMEDVVARGADPRDSTRPLTVEEAASGVRGLARLHGAYWGSRLTGRPELGWVEPFVAFSGLEYAPLHIAHERLGDTVPSAVLALSGTELFVDIWARYIGTLTAAGTPPTLLHGDPHIGNTYVAPDESGAPNVGFLDWQMVRRGSFSLDLGYFLQGALTTADRRGHERDLLAEYRRALPLPDDEVPTEQDVWLGYRASVAHGLAIWMATLSGGDAWQRPDICLAFAQRYAAAFVDLETPDAIDAISA
ncbi:phosphotransferase [Mycobacterium sp. Y57]|uniref:phosphotransferase n=1 Tax=Mycolicibacterium xanthum TaxID=2796469 RepID=UPI001C864F79|nr:phosphotransferase [Mycolicibacterium xanthum]MBX7433301.1 phosphotransferase [Mycolicibacterium xanthum]